MAFKYKTAQAVSQWDSSFQQLGLKLHLRMPSQIKFKPTYNMRLLIEDKSNLTEPARFFSIMFMHQ